MRSPTSSEGSQLVRIVVPCAQMRVSRPRGHRDACSSEWRKAAARFKGPAQQATKPRVKQEVRSVLCHSLVIDSTGENVAIHNEFEQLLLTCIKGCGLRNNRFKVHAAAGALY